MGVLDRKAREFSRREREILDSAFGLFIEKGFDSVTIDMIAERAEVGKGTIYKHFGSKNDIFLQLAIRQDRSIQEKLLEVDSDAPVLVQFRGMLRVFWDYSMSDPRACSVFRGCENLLKVSDLCPETRESVSCSLNVYREILTRVYQQAVDEQIFKDVPVEYFAIATKSMFCGSIDEVISGELSTEASPEKLYLFLEETLIKGFMR